MYLYTAHCGQCVIQVWGYGKTLCLFVYLSFCCRKFSNKKSKDLKNKKKIKIDILLIERDYILLWFAYHWFV